MKTHRPRRHRLRLLALWVLALAMVWQPVLATAGELHALAHATHAAVAADASTGMTPAPDGDEDPLLHLLLDFAHCCAASPVLVARRLALAVPAVPCHARPCGAPTVTAAPQPPPFKPPIHA